VLGQSRSTQRRQPQPDERDQALVEQMRKLVRQHPRYGYRLIWGRLRAQGWQVNRKRVYRLWKQAGLKVRPWARKRTRAGAGANACHVRRPKYPNHVWSYDITHDRTLDGRGLKFLVVLDEYTRQCLALEVGRSMTAKQVLRVLERLVRVHGAPAGLRSDNGPEFVAKRVKEWLAQSGIETLYIEPGSPWQNGYVESFNSRLEDEFLSQQLFRGREEAEALAEHYRLEYNHVRPHSSLGYKTPARYAAEWVPVNVASAPAARRPSTNPESGERKKSDLEPALP
jgi:putative transposase